MAGVIRASTHVAYRSAMGRFIAECEAAPPKVIAEGAAKGASLSRGLAPMRTGALIASIQPFITSRTSGGWGASARYALAQERGASAHPITGQLVFFWRNKGRMFRWDDQRFNPQQESPVTVQHPGNPAHPYLKPASAAINRQLMEMCERAYPG